MDKNENVAWDGEKVNYIKKEHKQKCLKKPASLTVEASIIMWILIMTMSMVLLVFVMIKKEIVVYQTMYEASEDSAMMSVVSEDGMEVALVADGYRIWGRKKRGSTVNFIAAPHEDGYKFSGLFTQKFPFISEKTYKVIASQHLFVRSWSGYCRDGEEGQYVYITRSGSVYHKTTACSHLRLSIREVPYEMIDKYRSEDGAKYYPCSSCGKRVFGGIVYITTDGNRYHGNRECKSLMRYIKKVLLRDVKDTHRPCKDCC